MRLASGARIPDFDVMKKFTGYLRPGNYDIFKYLGEQKGVLDEDKDSRRLPDGFSLACYKEEIEANLRTPGLAGFQLLELTIILARAPRSSALWTRSGKAKATSAG